MGRRGNWRGRKRRRRTRLGAGLYRNNLKSGAIEARHQFGRNINTVNLHKRRYYEVSVMSQAIKISGAGSASEERSVRPVRGHLTPKMNIGLFNQTFDAEYFFIRQFFQKKLYFQRKRRKIVLAAHLTIF